MLRSKQRRAMTLVEILVVLAIAGIMIALLLPAFHAARNAARKKADQTNSAPSFEQAIENGDILHAQIIWMTELPKESGTLYGIRTPDGRELAVACADNVHNPGPTVVQLLPKEVKPEKE